MGGGGWTAQGERQRFLKSRRYSSSRQSPVLFLNFVRARACVAAASWRRLVVQKQRKCCTLRGSRRFNSRPLQHVQKTFLLSNPFIFLSFVCWRCVWRSACVPRSRCAQSRQQQGGLAQGGEAALGRFLGFTVVWVLPLFAMCRAVR